jgi:acetyl-CoA carboxylase biotin carboxyl carrier protein
MAGTGKRQTGAPPRRTGRTQREAKAGSGENGMLRPGAGNGRSREAGLVPAGPPVLTASGPGAAGGLMIDLDFLRGLIGAVDASGIDSIEITRAGTRIRISKTPPVPAPVSLPAIMPAALAAPATTLPAPAGGAAPAASAVEAEAPSRPDLFEVKSPMVGTYYRAPAPEAPPYVDVGSHITRGQTLCILEAMKLMNELESEVDGIVREVLVDNAEPVEFGQVLYRIEVKA